MFEVASFAGALFLAFGLWDRRARPMALLLAFVWLEATLIDQVASVDAAVALKPVVDFVGGVMALALITRERWNLMVPALFCVMMLAHAGYWIAWHNGVDLWYTYAHALTALWLLQLAAVAWPAGGQLIGISGAWLSRVLDGWRSNAILVPWEQKARAIGSYRQDDVGSGRNLQLSIDKRN